MVKDLYGRVTIINNELCFSHSSMQFSLVMSSDLPVTPIIKNINISQTLLLLLMACSVELCNIATCVFNKKMLCAEDALHLTIECTPTYLMYCTFKLKFEMSSAIKMHCHVSSLTNLLSRILYIVLDTVILVSWIYVSYVEGKHNGIQK